MRPLDQWPTEWRNIRGSPRGTRKNNEESTKLERSSAIALHVLETEHHVDFDNPEILSKYWPFYRDRINAEQWFISHQPEACNLKGKTITAKILLGCQENCLSLGVIFLLKCWRKRYIWYCPENSTSRWVYEKRQTSRDLWRKIGCCWRFDSLCRDISLTTRHVIIG